jgi:hypothetical protein
MTFELKLNVPTALMRTETGQFQYDPEVDDVGSVLCDICEALETSGVSFLVRVCSNAAWPVTVSTDLLVAIEQIGDTLADLAQGQIGRLDFYEQGIERVISFTPNNGDILVECNDMIVKATSKPEVVILPRELVLKELTCLAEDFLGASHICCPELVNHPWFQEWAAELRNTLNNIRPQDATSST